MKSATLIKSIILLFIAMMVPYTSYAEGLDAYIDRKFAPFSQICQDVVFVEILGVPLVLILLVLGALFFTVVFGFVNIRKFPTSVNVVRGKYDEVEGHGIADKTSVNVSAGDIVDTIRDESEDGEVSHFQALATAVSGTVGNGNIAGVALAIAIGGPGATFWMIICGLLGMSSKFVECTLGVKYRDVGEDGTVYGGPMYYLSKGLKERGFLTLGKILAGVFAVLCILASFAGGNAAQSNQAAQELVALFGMESSSSSTIIGVIMAILSLSLHYTYQF